MSTVGVVLRQLGSHPVVVSAVIEAPIDEETCTDAYLQYRFSEIQEEFCRQYVEFRSAEWTLQIINTRS